MQNGNEWYWNLNIHRDQLSLVNSSIANAYDLPISSTLYTSAVLNDNGICVGMRNVHLKGENAPCLHRSQKIPNCSSNRNVVGERNQQYWTMAYDRMKFSALTDPSMAIHSSQVNGHGIQMKCIQPHELHHNTIVQKEFIHEPNMMQQSMFAKTNPFHLFGDSATLLSFKPVDQKLNFRMPHNFVQPTFVHHSKSCAELHSMDSISQRCQKVLPTKKCYRSCASIASSIYPNASQFLSKSFNKMDESQSDYVAPPKKKWMRNYMQSNLFIMFLSLFYSFLFINH